MAMIAWWLACSLFSEVYTVFRKKTFTFVLLHTGNS